MGVERSVPLLCMIDIKTFKRFLKKMISASIAKLKLCYLKKMRHFSIPLQCHFR